MSTLQTVRNFGHNVVFTPREIHAPRTEQEVLDLLDQHAAGRIRVVGSRHAWSPAIVTDDVLLDLSHFNRVQIEHGVDGEVWATVGGGCQIKRVLAELDARAGCTLPAIGMITEQTIAGATATGTHGSGRHCLSHYLEEVRFAAYDPHTGRARIFVVRKGDELQAARCALGCIGVVLSVRMRCVPQYFISEVIARYKKIEDVLAFEQEYPRQHFFLIPHLWEWYGLHQRELAREEAHLSRFAWLFKLYTVLVLDIGFHLNLKFLLSLARSPAFIRRYCRKLLPAMVLEGQKVVGRSDQFLTIQIERFRHLEMELFVRTSVVQPAARFVQDVLMVADGAAETVSAEFAADLERAGLLTSLYRLRGTFTHHYPITFRRVLPDNTLISMCSGSDEAWYAISFISYAKSREKFFTVCDFLAHSMAALFGARPHWGKYFPLNAAEIERLYPNLPAFREICRRYDPHGTFLNPFCRRTLGFAPDSATIPEHAETPGAADSSDALVVPNLNHG